MAIYRSVQMTFWTDAKVVDNFTPEDRYFYLYLLTNPHTNLCGCYEISFKQISDETGYTKEVVERLLDRMENTHNVIRYSRITKELLMINWSKFNWTKSDKFRKPLLSEIESVKELEFKNFLIGLYKDDDTVSIPYRYPIDTTVTVTDTVNNIPTNLQNTKTVSLTVCEKKPKKFVPPTLEEVEAYCRERNNDIDPEGFIAFYDSKGWMVGKNKMKNWKSAVITFEKHQPGYVSKREQQKREQADKQKGLVHIDDWTKVDVNGNYHP